MFGQLLVVGKGVYRQNLKLRCFPDSIWKCRNLVEFSWFRNTALRMFKSYLLFWSACTKSSHAHIGIVIIMSSSLKRLSIKFKFSNLWETLLKCVESQLYFRIRDQKTLIGSPVFPTIYKSLLLTIFFCKSPIVQQNQGDYLWKPVDLWK